MAADPIVAPTLNVLKSRITALELVVAVGPDRTASLNKYLAERDARSDEKAPPIQKYVDLVTIADYEHHMETQFRRCTSNRDLQEVKRALKNNSAAISDLINVCKSLLKDMRKCMSNSSRLKKVGAEAGRRCRKCRCFDSLSQCEEGLSRAQSWEDSIGNIVGFERAL